MKGVLPLTLLFGAVVVAYDAFAASIAAALTISYNSFLLPGLVILFFMGVLAGRVARSWSGAVPVTIAAVIDATAGWYVAALIGPGYVPGWTPRALIVMGAESALLSAAIGWCGVWIGIRVAQTQRRPL
jgi:hypothetical protein